MLLMTSHRALRPWLAALCLAGGCAAHALAAAPRLQVAVQDAALRAPKPGFSAAVVVLQLQAHRDALLLGASSPAAGAVELQRTVRLGSEVRMERLPDALPLPAGTPVRLQVGEGRVHLMATGLKPQALRAGHIMLRLRLADSAGQAQRSIDVKVPVARRPGAGDVAEDHLH